MAGTGRRTSERLSCDPGDLPLRSRFSVHFTEKIVYRKEAIGRRKCLEYGTICSNAGFLGNPIAEGVFGAEGLVLASFF